MTESERRRVLTEIYAQVPDTGCKGLCANHCTSIGLFDAERKAIEQVTGRHLEGPTFDDDANMVVIGDEGPCPFLAAGRCSVYEHRPIICRVFGSVEGMRCPHGCRPERLMTDGEVFDLFSRVEAL